MSYDAATRSDLKNRSLLIPFVTLNARQLCDIELLLNGGFNPLSGFLGRDDYESVLNSYRLKDGSLWPIPITLDITCEKLHEIELAKAKEIALKDQEGNLLATLTIDNPSRDKTEAPLPTRLRLPYSAR